MSTNSRLRKALEKLARPEAENKVAAAMELAELGDQRAIEPLKAYLLDKQAEVRGAAAKALDRLWEQKWKLLIQGDDLDFVRICKSLDLEALLMLQNVLQAASEEYRRFIERAICYTLPELWPNPGFATFHGLVRENLIKVAQIQVNDKDPQAITVLREYIQAGAGKPRKETLEKLSCLGIDLRNIVLARADLRFARLKGAHLYSADLQEAQLMGAVLSFADLSRADFRQAELKNADLNHAVCVASCFREADLAGADLSNADLRKSNFDRANLHLARLEEARLEDANCTGAEFNRANLRQGVVSGTCLRDAVMLGAILTGATVRDCDLSGVDFHSADLTDAVFSRVDLRQARGLTVLQLAKCRSLAAVSLEDELARTLQQDFPNLLSSFVNPD